MNKRVLLGLAALLSLWSGCKKEPPDIMESQAYAISEKEVERICAGSEGGAGCKDFLYMGVFAPEDAARFKWAFHFLAQQLNPMNLVIVEVSVKGEPATMLKRLPVGSDLSKYKLKGTALALTGAQVPSGSAMAGKSPEQSAAAKPAEAGKPAEGKPGEAKPGDAKAAAAKPAEAKPGETKPVEAKQGAPKPAEASPVAAKPAEKPAPPPPAPPKPAAPAVAASTKTAAAGTPTTLEEMYPAGSLRNPFVKVEGGKDGAASLTGVIPEGEFSIHGLALKGLMDDRGDGIAILVDPKYGASFVLRRGKLYDPKNKPVYGVRGSVKVKQRTVVLTDESGESATITMAEPSDARGGAGESGSSGSGSPGFTSPGASSGSSSASSPPAPPAAAPPAAAAPAAAGASGPR